MVGSSPIRQALRFKYCQLSYNLAWLLYSLSESSSSSFLQACTKSWIQKILNNSWSKEQLAFKILFEVASLQPLEMNSRSLGKCLLEMMMELLQRSSLEDIPSKSSTKQAQLFIAIADCKWLNAHLVNQSQREHRKLLSEGLPEQTVTAISTRYKYEQMGYYSKPSMAISNNYGRKATKSDFIILIIPFKRLTICSILLSLSSVKSLGVLRHLRMNCQLFSANLMKRSFLASNQQ